MVEVEDQQAFLQMKKAHKRRALIWLAATVLIGLLVGLMAGRLINPLPEPGDKRLLWKIEETAQGIDISLRAPGQIDYQRFEYEQAIGYRFSNVHLEKSPIVGRKAYEGKTLAWRLENREEGVQILLLGLKTELNVEAQTLPVRGGRAGLMLHVKGQ